MNDAVAAFLQSGEDARQRRDGARLDVVQQQDALALGLDALDREVVDPLRRDVAPVVGREVGAPDLDALRRQIGFRNLGAHQAGNPEERRELALVAVERGERRGDAVVDFLPHLLERHLVHRQRMVLAVRADGMPGRDQLAHAVRIEPGLGADGEEGRLDALAGEDGQHLVAVFRQRPIVKGQHHLVVGERQRLRILHGADPRMLHGIDDESPRGAECVGITRAVRGKGGLRRHEAAAQQCRADHGPRPLPDHHQDVCNHRISAAFQTH